MVPARDRTLPVDEAFISLLPTGSLQRGRVVGCTGPAAVTLAVALAARSVISGSWLAAVGVPMLGVEACRELGLPLSRLVHVGVDGGPAVWAERVAAAVDGFDVVLARPPAGAERVLRKVRTRLQARGAVLVVVSPTTAPVSCDIELGTTSIDWVGTDRGAGRLAARRAVVRCGGRRVPRPIERELWLPGPDGRVEPAESHQQVADGSVVESGDVDDAIDVVELSRAG